MTLLQIHRHADSMLGRGYRRDSRKARCLAFSGSLPVEVLEARKLMAAYTDVSQIAAQTPTHAGPTNLYINFDGGVVPTDPVHNPHGGTQTIAAFETAPGDTGLDREKDIQDILFQVSEVYAPFNVEVHRIYGAGSYSTGNGDTTVFVGGNLANSTTTASPTSFGPGLFQYKFSKYSYSFTPGSSLDVPVNGHVINSDPYDVAFVDPVVTPATTTQLFFPNYQTQLTERVTDGSGRIIDYTHINTFDIVRSIAHEAGHTFGLSHVRTDGGTDPTPLGPGTVNDVMSYDSTNQYFADQSLNLTAFNYNGTSTTLSGTVPNYLNTTYLNLGFIKIPITAYQNLLTQNSFLSLEFTLGVRPTDQYANVANSSDVDPAYGLLGRFGIGPGAAPKVDLSQHSIQYGTLGRLGDDQVFTITPTTTGIFQDNISVHPTVGNLKPEILVYDSTGTNLLQYADPSSNGVASLNLPNGSSYQLVIASQDGNSTGSYYIGINPVLNFGAITAPPRLALTAIVPNTAQTPTPTVSTGTVSPSIGASQIIPLVASTPDITLVPVVTLTTTKPKALTF